MTARDLESVFAASVDSNADDEHDPEGQTISFERTELAEPSTLIRAAQQHLSDIDMAAARLEDGDYGTCAVCLQPIPAARPRHAGGTKSLRLCFGPRRWFPRTPDSIDAARP